MLLLLLLCLLSLLFFGRENKEKEREKTRELSNFDLLLGIRFVVCLSSVKPRSSRELRLLT